MDWLKTFKIAINNVIIYKENHGLHYTADGASNTAHMIREKGGALPVIKGAPGDLK